MAEFTNPIRTRIQGEIPKGDTGALDLSRTVGAAIDFGAEAATEAATGRLSEGITEEAERFLGTPGRISDLQRLTRELEEERSSQPQMQNDATMRRLKRDVSRLRKAQEQGAISSGEVKIRADQLTRKAISDNPTIADALIRERNKTLGLFQNELAAADAALSEEEEFNELQMRSLKQQQEALAEMGIFVSDPDRIIELSAQNVVKPRYVEAQLDALKNRNELTKEQARRMAPDVVQAASSRAFIRINQVLNRTDLNADEKVQQLEKIRLDERNRLSERLNILGSEELDRRFNRIDRVIEKNTKALVGEFSAEEARNSLNTLVLEHSGELVSNDPTWLATAIVNEIGGDALTTLLAEREMGGVRQKMQGLVDQVKGMVQGTAGDGDAETINIFDQRLDAFTEYYEGTQKSIQDGTVSATDGKKAFKNVLRYLLPNGNKDMTEVPLEKWHAALDAMAKPGFKNTIEALDMSPEETTRFAQRVIDYNTEVLEPNITRALLEEIDVSEQVSEFDTTTSMPLVSFIEPVFNEESGPNRGHITFVPNEARINDLGGIARERIQKKVRDLNRTYGRRWNQSITVNANLRRSDPLRISVTRWNDRFATEEPEEGGGGE